MKSLPELSLTSTADHGNRDGSTNSVTFLSLRSMVQLCIGFCVLLLVFIGVCFPFNTARVVRKLGCHRALPTLLHSIWDARSIFAMVVVTISVCIVFDATARTVQCRTPPSQSPLVRPQCSCWISLWDASVLTGFVPFVVSVVIKICYLLLENGARLWFNDCRAKMDQRLVKEFEEYKTEFAKFCQEQKYQMTLSMTHNLAAT